MTLSQKFMALTAEQKEQFAAVKNGAALDRFLSEHGITLTEEEKQSALEYFQSGILLLDDDDLETVAGGQSKEDSAKQAHADGRTIPMPSGLWWINEVVGYCTCNHQYKWAKSKEVKIDDFYKNNPEYYKNYEGHYIYHSVKCYKCGSFWNRIAYK